MIYYKDDANGEVYAYYHADLVEGLIREGLRAMTAEEVLAHLNPVPVYWTDGATLVHAKYGADGWWQASDDEIAAMLPLVKIKGAEQAALALRKVADSAIAPLQDAVDLDEATVAEVESLKAWKKYRIALIRVPEQSGYPAVIDWPEPMT